MYPKQFDIDPIDVDADGICESQTTAGSGPLVLNGALCDVGTAAQFNIEDSYSSGIGGVKIGITSTGNLSGVTFSVTGKDADGQSISEGITGPNNSTVQSTNYYSEITSILVTGAVGTAVTVGTVDEVVTKTVPINRYASQQFSVAGLGVTGTIQFDIQQCFNNVPRVYPDNWINISSNQTADVAANAATSASAVRLVVDSYSSGAEVQFYVTGQ